MIPDVDPDDFDHSLSDVEQLLAPARFPARRIGILSGTGPHGRGLARRFSMAGHEASIGSRDVVKAREVARKLTDRVPPANGGRLVGASNDIVAQTCEVAIVACAWPACEALLTPLAPLLAGKVVVSCVNPLGFDQGGAYSIAPDGSSAAETIAQLLPASTVVAAFHHLSAAHLLDPNAGVAGEDVLVAGESHDGKVIVRQLCHSLTGRLGTDAGGLRLARYIEPFTAVLISVNKRYSAQSGIVLSDLDREQVPTTQCAV